MTKTLDRARKFAGRRMFVTGAAGFLGRHVVAHAIDQGAAVTAAVRPGTNLRRLDGIHAPTVEVDLCQGADTADALADFDDGGGFDVIHCASNSGHASPDSHVDAWNTNLMATVHLLAALRSRHDVRLVHIGAGTEYGPSDIPHREASAMRPVSVRGASKLAATTAVEQWAHEFQMAVSIVRPFSVYGVGEPPTRLVSTLFQSARYGTPFSLVEGTSRRDLVSVIDVAEGTLRALAIASPDAPVLNLGTGVEHTVGDVVQLVALVTGKSINVDTVRRRREHHDAEHWVADTTTCERLLRWKPDRALHTGLADMWSAVRI